MPNAQVFVEISMRGASTGRFDARRLGAFGLGYQRQVASGIGVIGDVKAVWRCVKVQWED